MSKPKTYTLDFRRHFHVLNEDYDPTRPESPDNQKLIDSDQQLTKVVSRILQVDTAHEPVKIWTWAVAIHGGGVVVLDKPDFDLLRGALKRNGMIHAAAKAEIEQIFIESEKSGDKPQQEAPPEE